LEEKAGEGGEESFFNGGDGDFGKANFFGMEDTALDLIFRLVKAVEAGMREAGDLPPPGVVLPFCEVLRVGENEDASFPVMGTKEGDVGIPKGAVGQRVLDQKVLNAAEGFSGVMGAMKGFETGKQDLAVG
jgi:hypothetical protein